MQYTVLHQKKKSVKGLDAHNQLLGISESMEERSLYLIELPKPSKNLTSTSKLVTFTNEHCKSTV
jgi:hypothetical protein